MVDGGRWTVDGLSAGETSLQIRESRNCENLTIQHTKENPRNSPHTLLT